MNLDLTEEETAALVTELDRIIENDRYPVLATNSDAQRNPRRDQTLFDE